MMESGSNSTRNIRVMHFINSLSGGGAERQLMILANNFPHQRVDTAIFCSESFGLESSCPSKIYVVSKHNRYNIKLFKEMNSAINEFKPDIIHTWLPASMTIPAILLAGWNGVPLVISFRNKKWFRSLLDVTEYLLSLLVCDKVISNNPVTQSSAAYQFLYKTKHGVEIPNAVDIPDHLKKVDRPRKNPVNIIFVGRLTYQKNIKCLLKALQKLIRYDWRLSICGSGEDDAIVRTLIREYGIDDRVSMLGFRRDVYDLMSSSDLIVIPSYFEGMPNILIESLELGIPCIVSYITAHRSILDSFGQWPYFDPDSPDELAKHISHFIENPDSMATFVEKGKHIATQYSPAIMTSRFRTTYDSLLSDKPG